MNTIIIFLALLCGAVAQTFETAAPVSSADAHYLVQPVDRRPALSNPPIEDVIRQSAWFRAEAADVVKAMKLLLAIADPTSPDYVMDNLVLIKSTPAAKAQEYANQLKQREKDIAWARSVLAKWEQRAK